MPLEKYFIAVLCLLATAPVLGAAGGDSNGLEPRVSALEEMTLQQQEQIDQNIADIDDIKDTLENLPSGEGGGIGWSIQDANGDDVGTLVSLGSSIDAVVELDAGGETFLATVGRWGFQYFGHPLYFNSLNCTVAPGQGVFTSINTDAWQSVGVAIFVEVGFPDTRVPYLVSATPIDQDIGSESTLGFCSSYYGTYSFSVLPVVSLGVDLNVDYPPPYTLVKD